jgi:hypothetical protein
MEEHLLKVATGEPAPGWTLRPYPFLRELRDCFQDEFRRLPQPYKELRPSATYPVRLSAALEELEQRLTEELTARCRPLGES